MFFFKFSSSLLRFSALGWGPLVSIVSVGGSSHKHTFLMQVYALCSEGLALQARYLEVLPACI